MKWKLAIVMLSILLAGCSYVSVDEQEEKTENEQNTSSTNATNNDVSEKEPSKLEELLDTINIFDWGKDKAVEAQDIYYLALGDSLTHGVGDETDAFGFTGVLKTKLEQSPNVLSVELDNRGKNGRRTDQLLALLEKGHYDEELEKTNFITITQGGNDVMKVVKNNLLSLDTTQFDEAKPSFVERYTDIVTYIRSKTDAPIIFVGFYNPFSIVTDEENAFETIISEWNKEVETIVAETSNACFVSVEDIFGGQTDYYHTDFFHPNTKGYELMAERVIETIPSCENEQLTNLFDKEDEEDE